MGARALRLTCTLAAVVLVGTSTGAAAAAPAVKEEQCSKGFTEQPTEVPWPLEMFGQRRLHALTQGQGVIVAVIDSGVSTDHPQMAGAVLPGRDLIDGGKGDGTKDCYGHGTVVGGIIAARPKQGSPYVGLAPAAMILPLRVFRDDKNEHGVEAPGRVADAINEAVARHAGVINLSLTALDTPELRKAVQAAIDKDVVVVAASGNCENGDPNLEKSPAIYPNVISVGGIDSAGHHVPTSCPNKFVSLGAPGIDVDGPAVHGGGFAHPTNGGTSYAAPYVSAAAALIRSYYPDMRAAEVRARLLATADRPPGGRDDKVGYGVVDPYRAVTAILPRGGAGGAAVRRPLPPSRPTPDPLAGANVAAAAAAGGALLLVITGLAAAAVVPRGRRRRWRAGRSG